MKPVLQFIPFVFLAAAFLYFSCQKELSCEDCIGNTPPIANAGIDTSITLPSDNALLDGSDVDFGWGSTFTTTQNNLFVAGLVGNSNDNNVSVWRLEF